MPQEDSQASAHTPAEGANPPPKPTQPRDSEPTQQVAYPPRPPTSTPAASSAPAPSSRWVTPCAPPH